MIGSGLAVPAVPIRDALTFHVDESGDPGIRGNGTRWLVFAGVAELPGPPALRRYMHDLRTLLGRQETEPLHFRKLSSNQKVAAYIRLAAAPLAAIVVASDTAAAPPGGEPSNAGNQYRYALSFLLERASLLAASRGRPLDFVVERSHHMTIDSFEQYVARLSSGFPRSFRGGGRLMQWSTVEQGRIRAANKEDEPELWAADGVAHAFHLALEHGQLRDGIEPIYADILQPRLWRGPSSDQIERFGFTFMPTSLAGKFFDENEAIRTWVVDQQQIAPLLWKR